MPTRSLPPALQPVLEAIPRAMIADRRRLHARLMQLAGGPRDEAGLAALQEQVRRSAARAE
ncbi:MAG: hypothetical protein LW822_07580, partial [Phycisphaeraceae bacterium]|nr:hypothetical protein [Phycisphaeraceae bacterium]